MMASRESQNEQDQQRQQQQPQHFLSPGAARFPKWVALAVLSIVGWISILSRGHSMDGSEKWSLAVTTLSMVFGIIGVCCYLFARGMFMGQLPELVLGGLILGLWASGLPVIMNPVNSIAVSYTQVTNANLYFASWGSFLCILMVCGSLAKEMYAFDLVGMATPYAQSKQGKWYALLASSLVVMGASIRVFKAFQCTLDVMQKAPTCRQSKLSISAGVIGTVMAAFITLASAKGGMSRQWEWINTIIILIVWCFGLGYVTFGEGPGHSIGNLYFATWASFVLSVLLFAESCRDHMGAREQQQASDLALEEEDDGGEDGAMERQASTDLEEVPVGDDDL